MSIIPPGWALLSAAAAEMPGGAAALLAALQEQKLKAFLLVAPRPNREHSWLKEGRPPGRDEGKRFEVAGRFWSTAAAQTALKGRWLEAPVLEPWPGFKGQMHHVEVDKGGYVLVEAPARIADPAIPPAPAPPPQPLPGSLAQEVARIAPALGITPPMRFDEKKSRIHKHYKDERRTPPGDSTIKDGLRLAGLSNPRARRG